MMVAFIVPQKTVIASEDSGIVLLHSKENSGFAREVLNKLEKYGEFAIKSYVMEEVQVSSFCAYKKIIAIDNASFREITEACTYPQSKTSILGAYLYPNNITRPFEGNEDLNRQVLLTTPGMWEQLRLAVYNGYHNIGFLYSYEHELSDIALYMKSYDLNLDLEAVRVSSENEAIKSMGVLASKKQAVIIGFNPKVFTSSSYRIIARISIKSLVPVLGGQYQYLLDSGVTAGEYYPVEEVSGRISDWIRGGYTGKQTAKFMVNHRMEAFIGKRFVQVSSENPY